MVTELAQLMVSIQSLVIALVRKLSKPSVLESSLEAAPL